MILRNNFGTSLDNDIVERRWARSKLWPHTHVSSKSSTMKRRFGGTHVVCMGDRSVPMTLALGYLSATGRHRHRHQYEHAALSLPVRFGRDELEAVAARAGTVTLTIHGPRAGAGAQVDDLLWVVAYGREEELAASFGEEE